MVSTILPSCEGTKKIREKLTPVSTMYNAITNSKNIVKLLVFSLIVLLWIIFQLIILGSTMVPMNSRVEAPIPDDDPIGNL